MTAIEEIEEIDAPEMHPIREMDWFGPVILDRYFTKEEFTKLSDRYPHLQVEREKDGKITIMSPVKAGSGRKESIVIGYLFMWRYQTKLGKTYSSSTGIELPDGSIKSPDCAWVSPERLALTTPEEEEEDFLKVVPDFVAEVRSRTDRLKRLQKKMTDVWMKNGVRLAWLIDPYSEKVHIYRNGKTVEIVEGFTGRKLSGEDVMPGMELPLDELKVAGQ